MRRLREIQDYLVDKGGFKKEHLTCHVTESQSVPVEQETETGVHLFDDRYEAVIFIEDVSEKEYGYLRMLLYDWFREFRTEGEEYRLSADPVSDVSALVTVSMTLVEPVHISPTVDGPVERDDTRYQEAEEPVLYGI